MAVHGRAPNNIYSREAWESERPGAGKRSERHGNRGENGTPGATGAGTAAGDGGSSVFMEYISDIRLFIKVVRKKSFSSVAAETGTSQSSISKQIGRAHV